MVTELKRGDQVLTQGGIIGKITKIKDESEIELEYPFHIFKYIIELFETGECDLQLIEKLSYKNELIEWCKLYCLNNIVFVFRVG